MDENRNIIIGIVLFFIILIGGIWLFAGSDTADGPSSINLPTTVNGVIQTTKGPITIELFIDRAPNTVGNFAALAFSGFYDGIKFHRIVPNFVVQVGDPLTKELPIDDPRIGTGGSSPIADEFHPELRNVRGTLSMANSGPNTGSSQFFINLVDNNFLDFDQEPLTSKHAVFGRVTGGMDVVASLEVGDEILSVAIEGGRLPQ